MDPQQWCMLGGSAAALIAGVYVLWGPDNKGRKRKRDLPPGLLNLGNTCFMNVVLQSLAACPSFVEWLGDFIDGHISDENYTSYLAYTMVRVMKVLTNQAIVADPFSPVEILEALRARRWVISTEEQDAHELFQVLTSTLDEEKTAPPSVVSLFNIGLLQMEEKYCVGGGKRDPAITRAKGSLPPLTYSGQDHPFKGLLASQLRCKKCWHKCPVKYDHFDSLSLSLPAEELGPHTLEGLLQQFVMSETVQNVECENCQKASCPWEEDGATARTAFIKQLTLGKLPQCMCVHIQRTVWLDNGSPTKRKDQVLFPEYLDMAAFRYKAGLLGGRAGGVKNGRVPNGILHRGESVPQSPVSSCLSSPAFPSTPLFSPVRLSCYPSMTMISPFSPAKDSIFKSTPFRKPVHTSVYRLVAVIVHLGEVFSGHFVCYRRAPGGEHDVFSEKWIKTSDMMVRRALLQEVLGAEVYLLFYEKVRTVSAR